MDSHNKNLQKFDYLRIISGKLISDKITYSKQKNLAKFCYLTLCRDWDTLTNDNSQYSNR